MSSIVCTRAAQLAGAVSRSETFAGTWDHREPLADYPGDVRIEAARVDESVRSPAFVATVHFAAGARTHWHRHDGGQVLHVLEGRGWICDEGGSPQRIEVGDVVHCEPGVVHWHGAAADSALVHFAVSLGETEFLRPVEG